MCEEITLNEETTNLDMGLDIIDINKETVSNLHYDDRLFAKGIKEMSFISGMITALVNTGVSPVEALNFLSEREANEIAVKSNCEIAKLQTESNLSIAKYGYENTQKNLI